MTKFSLRKFFLWALLFIPFMLSGCAGYMEYMGHSMQPVGISGAGTMTTYEAGNYTVLGTVKAEAKAKCILGIVIEGQGGNGLLWEAARIRFGEKVTGIKDIMSSYKYKGILPPIYSEIERTYVGTALQEK